MHKMVFVMTIVGSAARRSHSRKWVQVQYGVIQYSICSVEEDTSHYGVPVRNLPASENLRCGTEPIYFSRSRIASGIAIN